METEAPETEAKQTILGAGVTHGLPLLSADEAKAQVLALHQQVGDLECANALKEQTIKVREKQNKALASRNAALEDGIKAISAHCSWRCVWQSLAGLKVKKLLRLLWNSGCRKSCFSRGRRNKEAVMEEVKTSFFNKQYKLRSKLERACDAAMEEIHDTTRKLIAELPMQGFDKNVLSKIRFDLEISFEGDVFGYTLKHEIV